MAAEEVSRGLGRLNQTGTQYGDRQRIQFAGLVAVSLNEASGPYLLDFQDTIRVDTRKQAILAFFAGITAEKLSAQGQIHRQGSGETIHGRNHGRIGSTEVTTNQAAPHDADDFTRDADVGESEPIPPGGL